MQCNNQSTFSQLLSWSVLLTMSVVGNFGIRMYYISEDGYAIRICDSDDWRAMVEDNHIRTRTLLTVYLVIQVTGMPWLKIFTSGPVWALIIANFCTDWGLYTYLTNIPTFYNEVLFFDIQSVSHNNALFHYLHIIIQNTAEQSPLIKLQNLITVIIELIIISYFRF